MVCGEALRSCSARMNFATAFSTIVASRLVIVSGAFMSDAFRPCFEGAHLQVRRSVHLSLSSRAQQGICFFLPSRMMLLVHLVQPVKREMRVHLRGRNVGMTQNGLHCAQVGAILDHVRGATMPQHV